MCLYTLRLRLPPIGSALMVRYAMDASSRAPSTHLPHAHPQLISPSVGSMSGWRHAGEWDPSAVDYELEDTAVAEHITLLQSAKAGA